MKQGKVYKLKNSNRKYRVMCSKTPIYTSYLFSGVVIKQDEEYNKNDDLQVGDTNDGFLKDAFEEDTTYTQIGGTHYSNKSIQPIEYIVANELNFCEGNIIKYVTRYKDKNGIEDLLKAKHYLEMLISNYENKESI